MKQQTILQPFSFSGKGLHTGLEIQARFLPAPPDTGIRIARVDLPDSPTYPALADYVSATNRGTVLSVGEWRVSTVEHALSALYAMGVDNCLIEVNAPEMPILDGSSRCYVDAIRRVGLTEQEAERQEWVVTEPILIESGDGHRLRLMPADRYEVAVRLIYPDGPLAGQMAELTDLTDYADEVAAARTFCFEYEIKPLLSMGLIKGGDLENALVITETGYTSPLRYDNEPARHKLLDVIGDLSLTGVRIRGRIEVEKPGHTFNTHCARQLRENYINGK